MKLPVLPTLTAALGVPALIGLGVWQLERREEKAAALAVFARPQAGEVNCERWSVPVEQRAGRSASGRPGFAHLTRCDTSFEPLRANLGWSADPVNVVVIDARLAGRLYRLPGGERLLIVDPPLPGLQPSAPPSATDIPNNHLLYAAQWFSFAAALGVIYTLWLRRWRRERAGAVVSATSS